MSGSLGSLQSSRHRSRRDAHGRNAAQRQRSRLHIDSKFDLLGRATRQKRHRAVSAPAHSQDDAQTSWQGKVAAFAAAVCVTCAGPANAAVGEPSAQASTISSPDQYTEVLQSRHNRSKGITTDSSSNEYMMQSYAEELFLPDAWLGMKRLVEYARYVDSLEEQEDAPMCTDCKANREILEHAWQVVANEYFDPYGRFTQADWAARLQKTLESYGGTLKTKRELYSAAAQMINSLGDQYSAFLEPGAFRAAIRKPTKAELDYMSEQAVGVGMKLGKITQSTGRTVVATFSGSAAEAAGIKIGDVVYSLDGLPVSGFSDRQLASMMRGPVGTTMDVVVAHQQPTLSGSKLSYNKDELTLTRQPLQQVSAVNTMIHNYDPSSMSGLTQYIRINYFSSDATKTVMKAIVEGELAGVDGYIIDLRNNPGGVFEEAIAMSSYFLDGDNSHIVETVRYTDLQTHRNIIDNVWAVGMLPGEAFPTHAWGLTTRPVVLLTNHGTASASEVMAGALQDNLRGAVVGEQTFGKGVVQYFFRMDDGSGLKLTVAKYLTPNNHDVALEGGIKPDITCHDNPKSMVPPDGVYDQCIRQGLRYVRTHPGGSAGLLHAMR